MYPAFTYVQSSVISRVARNEAPVIPFDVISVTETDATVGAASTTSYTGVRSISVPI